MRRLSIPVVLALAALVLAGTARADRTAAVPTPPDLPGFEPFQPLRDLDGDGRISAEEFGRQNPRFLHLDGDGDGYLSAAEQEAGRQRLVAHATAGLALAADADRDGRITAAEWEHHLAALDADGDGAVAVEDLAPARRILRMHHGPYGGPGGAPFAGPEPPAPPHPPLLAPLFDPDGDGEVAVGDLEAAFSGLDTDRDGVLSVEELPGPGMLHLRHHD